MRTFALLLLFCFGGFMAGFLISHPAPPAPPPADKPFTDWKKFFQGVQDNKVAVTVAASLPTEKDNPDTTVYLVDGDRWYPVAHTILWSCGGPQEVYRSIHSTTSLKRLLNGPPSDKAKFVIVGPGAPILKEVKFHWFDQTQEDD